FTMRWMTTRSGASPDNRMNASEERPRQTAIGTPRISRPKTITKSSVSSMRGRRFRSIDDLALARAGERAPALAPVAPGEAQGIKRHHREGGADDPVDDVLAEGDEGHLLGGPHGQLRGDPGCGA